MPDYYSILWRALENGDFAKAEWRSRVFDRTRQMLPDQLRAQQPPLSKTEISLHMVALEAAIETIESEITQRRFRRGLHETRDQFDSAPPEGSADRLPSATASWPIGAGSGFGRRAWAAVAVLIAAVVAGVYAFETIRKGKEAPPPGNLEAANRQSPLPKSRQPALTSPDGDLEPGVDGGSTDADVSFVFRRQPVFYRTTHPVGTLIVDKQQRFLYLIQPNLVALRYGIGVGRPCADVAGLRRVSSKVEWPEWQRPADMAKRGPASPHALPGGPGNPLGARLIGLDDGTTHIHGTNAPKTIGSVLNSGCIRLVNDDIVDLYNRVAVGTRVVFSD